VIAREYGYPGWQDLTAEVSKRLGKGLERAAAEARRIIHDNDLAAPARHAAADSFSGSGIASISRMLNAAECS
jgi:hypothetical protein